MCYALASNPGLLLISISVVLIVILLVSKTKNLLFNKTKAVKEHGLHRCFYS